MLPQEIYERKEQYGLDNSVKLLNEIIETEKDVNLREEAIKYLGKISIKSYELKKRCYETLENLLISDENVEIKCLAAKSLGRIKYEKAISPLKWIIEQEETTNKVKESCLKAISNIRFHESEISLFIEQLKTNSPSIKAFVTYKLLAITPEILVKSLIASIKNEDYSEKHKVEILNLIGVELSSLNVVFDENLNYLNLKFPEIIALLKENKKILLETIVPNLKEDNKELLKNVLSILKVMGDTINSDIIRFLGHDDFIIKKNVIFLIDQLKIKECVPILLKYLDDIYVEVNKTIIKALGNMGDLSVIPELLKILNVEDYDYEYLDFDIKWEILDAIKKIYLDNKNASFEALLSYLNSNNDILKESIAYIFGELTYPQFIIPLLRLLNEKNIDVRKNATIALGKIGSTEALAQLLNVVDDKNSYWILKKVAIDAVFNIYIKNLFEKNKSAIEQHRIFVQSTERLIDYLKYNKEDPYKVKLSIINVLKTFGGKTAIDVLLKQLDDFHRIVRIESSKAIRKIEKRLKKKPKNPQHREIS